MAYFTSARLENAHGTWNAAVRDISADGMFMLIPSRFKAGDRLKLAFCLRHSRQEIDLDAEIRRVTSEGVGVQIIWQ